MLLFEQNEMREDIEEILVLEELFQGKSRENPRPDSQVGTENLIHTLYCVH